MIAHQQFSTRNTRSYSPFRNLRGLIKIFTSPDRQFLTDVFADALRIAGQGNKVLIAQLLKGGIDQGQSHPQNLLKNLDWMRCETLMCAQQENITGESKLATLELWEHVKTLISDCAYDLVVLDELGVGIYFNIINEADALALLKSSSSVDIIITGSHIPESLVELADQVTHFRKA